MTDGSLAAQTDSYFLKTKAIVEHFGDRQATYAVFMRRPVISAPRFALEFLENIAAERGVKYDIELGHPEGAWGGAADAPIDVIGTGSYLPELWSETYATADIIAYDGVPMVKAGREFLLRTR